MRAGDDEEIHNTNMYLLTLKKHIKSNQIKSPSRHTTSFKRL